MITGTRNLAVLAGLAGALMFALAAGAAERGDENKKAPVGNRDLPAGASEDEVRKFCTRQYDDQALGADPTAAQWGGQTIEQLQEEFTRCLRRNGVNN